MTPRIHAIYNIFNEAQFIKQSLESVTWCDNIVVVDGAFDGFPAAQPQSNDGTMKIAAETLQQHRVDHIFYQFDHFAKGYEKTNAMLRHVPDGDYMLRMNGDEVVMGTPDLLKDYIADTNYLPFYQIPEWPPKQKNRAYYVPKLIKKTPTLKLTSKHIALTNTFTPEYRLGELPRGRVLPMEANVSLINVIHYCNERNAERQLQNRQWLKYYMAHQYVQNII